MWSYYGAKRKIASYYPLPQCDVIIEPFAGTAQYSLYGDNWEKDVILCDKYEVITSIWKYLQQASYGDIMQLPLFEAGESLNDYKYLSKEEKYLIGFCINPASAFPKKKVMARNRWIYDREHIANNLYKIKHWKIIEGNYEELRNRKATWFIDPPNQMGRRYYKYSEIDYKKLGKWCKKRKGQTIICDNMKAEWMNFRPLVKIYKNVGRETEGIWTSEMKIQL